MKKGTIALVVVAAAVAVLALAGCGGGGSSTRSPRLMGKVTDTSDLPIAGVTVSLTSNPAVTTTTNSAGLYVLKGVPSGTQEFTVTYSKPSYAESIAVAKVENGRWSTMDVVLFKSGATIHMDGTHDSVVEDNRADGMNCKITFLANSVVDASGAPVANPVVSITTASPDDARFNYAYPSLFVGVVGGGEMPLFSHGVVNVALKDSTGQPARLDPAKPATVEFPITPGHDPGTPTVPVWSLDKATGRWMVEAMASRDDTVSPAVYRAQVTHFSWWAINTYPSTTHYIIVEVVEDPTVSPMVPVCGAMVRVRRDRGAWQARGITSTQGIAAFVVPPPGPYWVEAKLDYYEDKGVYSQTTNGNITHVIYWLRPSNTGAPGGCPDCD